MNRKLYTNSNAIQAASSDSDWKLVPVSILEDRQRARRRENLWALLCFALFAAALVWRAMEPPGVASGLSGEAELEAGQ